MKHQAEKNYLHTYTQSEQRLWLETWLNGGRWEAPQWPPDIAKGGERDKKGAKEREECDLCVKVGEYDEEEYTKENKKKNDV